MGLFQKKEEKAAGCCCSCGTGAAEPCGCAETANTCCGKEVEGICCIKVLGAGCSACHKLYENVKEAAANLGLTVEVEYITDMQKVMEYGVMSMPAIVVNDRVVSMGKVLKAAEVEHLLRQIQS